MNETYKFTLKPLPYGYADLEPYIGEQSMRVHHTRHLSGYIDSLNKSIEKAPEYRGLSLTQIYEKAKNEDSQAAVDMRYYSSAVFNHNLYFSLFLPTGNDAFRVPSGELGAALRREYGSFERFALSMRDAAMSIRGSGWVFLCRRSDTRPEIIACGDHSRPSPAEYVPIILIDCWEHAYYIDYLDAKRDFFENYFRIINWELAEMFWNLNIIYR